MGTDEHKEKAGKTVGFSVVTVSDTRTEKDDLSGMAIIETMKDAGHKFVRKTIVKDEVEQIQRALREMLEDKVTNAVILNGGTGVSKRDVTLEAAGEFEEKALPGFGELFGMLSFEEVGSSAMMSRAAAFVTQGKIVFCLPGSERAVRLAVTRLVAPEVAHMVWEANR